MTTAPSPRSRLVFWVLAIVLVALGLELGSRAIEQVENAVARRKNPYVEAVNPAPAFEIYDDSGTKMVRRTGFHPLMAPNDRPFPLERPKGGLRIFVLGGSAAAGWPYHGGDTNLSALLERELRALYPGRPIEVMNMAAGTYASHRVKLILEEVVRYQPDAVFIYNGNNEFLENLVFRPRNPPSPLDRSAAARLTYRVATSLTVPLPRFRVKDYAIEDQAATRLSFAFGQTSRYREDPRQFEALLEQYRFNMESMVATAARAGVPLFLVTCPVNLREWAPNVSRHRGDLSIADKARWTAAFRQGYLALERGAFADAIPGLRAALAIDDEYAEAHFLLAEALRKTGTPSAARSEYVLALARDAAPFRELPEFQTILRDVAARHRVPLVDIIPPLEAVARDGIPGLDVFIDYVHLTEVSQEIVAHELLGALREHGIAQGVSVEDLDRVRVRVHTSFSPARDVFAADVNYNMAMMMHQYGRLDALYEQAVAVFRRAALEDPVLAEDCDRRIGLFRIVQAIVVPYRDLLRAEKLGLLQETYTPEQVRGIVSRYREMIYQTQGTKLSREEFARRFPASSFPGSP
jgi:tetratricopeptide (TPR) repeat protein